MLHLSLRASRARSSWELAAAPQQVDRTRLRLFEAESTLPRDCTVKIERPLTSDGTTLLPREGR